VKTTGVGSCSKPLGKDVENLSKILAPMGHTKERPNKYGEILEAAQISKQKFISILVK